MAAHAAVSAEARVAAHAGASIVVEVSITAGASIIAAAIVAVDHDVSNFLEDTVAA